MFDQFLARTVHDCFDQMLKTYDFTFFQNKETERNIHHFYKKRERLLDVKYNYTNHFIEIRFYKETDTSSLIGADFISLIDILRDNNSNYTYKGYDAIMPKAIPLEKSLEVHSLLLEQYGKPYLDGSEWKSHKDV